MKINRPLYFCQLDRTLENTSKAVGVSLNLFENRLVCPLLDQQQRQQN